MMKTVGCMLTEGHTFITCVNDIMTGEVYERFQCPQETGAIMMTGYARHEDVDDVGLGDVGLGEDGMTPLYCRILAKANMARVKNIHRRLTGGWNKKPLLAGGFWYRVLYD